MSRGMDQLHKLLFGEDRELVNIKFFPGTDRALSSDQLAEASCEMLRAILADPKDDPPVSGRTKQSVHEAYPA